MLDSQPIRVRYMADDHGLKGLVATGHGQRRTCGSCGKRTSWMLSTSLSQWTAWQRPCAVPSMRTKALCLPPGITNATNPTNGTDTAAVSYRQWCHPLLVSRIPGIEPMVQILPP